jgi:sulfatase maturation enzyme AslB (radical SAM superfamily)
VNKIWDCHAIDHAVTFLPGNKIAPCCIIKDYTKDITEISNPLRFADLKVTGVPANCTHCYQYKDSFNKYNNGVGMIDFRNSNLCNLKCRTCGPYASSSWAKELGHEVIFEKTDVTDYIDKVLTGQVTNIYFAGGEPLLNSDHWDLLDRLIETGQASTISLMYSTNLTVLGYKDKSVFDYWQQFKHVRVQASVDATGTAFEYIRSGSTWGIADNNLRILKSSGLANLTVEIAFTLSILSVWFFADVIKYANSLQLKVNVIHLTDPHFYTLNVMPSELVEQCVQLLTSCKFYAPYLIGDIDRAIDTVRNNDDVSSFMHMIASVLLTDKIRNEHLFELLPFKQIATTHILDINDKQK